MLAPRTKFGSWLGTLKLGSQALDNAGKLLAASLVDFRHLRKLSDATSLAGFSGRSNTKARLIFAAGTAAVEGKDVELSEGVPGSRGLNNLP